MWTRISVCNWTDDGVVVAYFTIELLMCGSAVVRVQCEQKGLSTRSWRPPVLSTNVEDVWLPIWTVRGLLLRKSSIQLECYVFQSASCGDWRSQHARGLVCFSVMLTNAKDSLVQPFKCKNVFLLFYACKQFFFGFCIVGHTKQNTRLINESRDLTADLSMRLTAATPWSIHTETFQFLLPSPSSLSPPPPTTSLCLHRQLKKLSEDSLTKQPEEVFDVLEKLGEGWVTSAQCW